MWFLMLIGHTKAGMYVWKYYGEPIFLFCHFFYGCGGGGCDSFGIRKLKVWVSIGPVKFVETSKIM